MKKTFVKTVPLLALVFSAALFTACKKEQPAPPFNDGPVVENIDTSTTTAVEIAPDTELATNVQDAVKDFPGVVVTVDDGEVILTGELSRDRLPALMQSLHALHPKKITNNLNVKK